MRDAIIHFATNRNRTGDAAMFGSNFGDPSDPDAVTYGTVRVVADGPNGTWRPDPDSLQIDPPPAAAEPPARAAAAAPAPAAAAPAQAAAVPAPASIAAFVRDASATHAMAAQAAQSTSPGLIFVHGYNTTFIDALKGAAQLGAQHQIVNMFVFSFPSFGNLALYAKDAENAGKSHAALADVITHLFGALKPHADQGLRLELLCHSLGNYVLSGAFKIMTSGHALLQTVYLRHAIHAAADVYAGSFSQRDGLAQIINLADEVGIYTNVWDKALAASYLAHILEGDPDRLGAVGPQNFATLPTRVNWIDCSRVAGNPLADLGHSYYASAPAVVADLDKVLKRQAAGTIQPRQSAGAPNHFVIPLDTHTITLVNQGRGNSTAGHA